MYIETILFASWFVSLLLLAFLQRIFHIQKSITNIIFIFLSLIFFYLYVFGINQYREYLQQKAIDSPHQIQQCGWFEYKIAFNQSKKKYDTAYMFRNSKSESEFIQLNGDTITQNKFQILNQLQPKQALCFQYSKDIKDLNDRYILTNIEITNH